MTSGRRLAAGRGSGHLLEYRDLALAVGGKGGAVPACPAVPEPEARDPGHEVELGRPDVPVGRGVAYQAAAGFDPVVRPRDLPGHVVEGLDPDVIGVHGENPRGLAGR